MSWRIVAMVSQGWSETVKKAGVCVQDWLLEPIFREEEIPSSG